MNRRVLLTKAMPEVTLEILRKANAEIRLLQGPRRGLRDAKDLLKGIREAEVLLARGVRRITRQVMMANPRLRGIANFGVGYDHVDMASATELGIPVTNTPGVPTEPTADLTWALLMAAARYLPQAHQFVASGKWKGPGGRVFLGQDIGPGASKRPKILGIIGFGRIGRAVVQRSRGFKMKVIVYDPLMEKEIRRTKGITYRRLDDLLRESDFVTLHCPLTPETRHLIGAREFNLMKPSAVLVNASRGPVVDEKALVSALKKRKIAGAGLDVYENMPRLSPGLAKLDNVVLLPHMGISTVDTRDQMARVAARNAVAMLRGKKPPHLVNPEVMGSAAYLARVRRGDRKDV